MIENRSAANDGQSTAAATDTAATSSVEGKCPVDYKNGGVGTSSLWKLFGRRTPGEKEGSTDSSNNSNTNNNNNATSTSSTTIPASLEEAARHAQTPHPHQRLPLSTHRAYSSIPRGAIADTNTTTASNNSNSNDTKPSIPHHQIVLNENQSQQQGGTAGAAGTEDDPTWVYPSEQQVFNAMKRKGWNGVEEESIPSFLQIHNSVNERSWKLLCDWEKKSSSTTTTGSSGSGSNTQQDEIRLVRFEGRPTDITPKAWILSTLGIQPKPFDRHDWYIDNGTDHEKRYVLDFYMYGDNDDDDGTNSNARRPLPRVDIDVRPALDTPQAIIQRGQRIFKELFPGITKELESIASRWN